MSDSKSKEATETEKLLEAYRTQFEKYVISEFDLKPPPPILKNGKPVNPADIEESWRKYVKDDLAPKRAEEATKRIQDEVKKWDTTKQKNHLTDRIEAIKDNTEFNNNTKDIEDGVKNNALSVAQRDKLLEKNNRNAKLLEKNGVLPKDEIEYSRLIEEGRIRLAQKDRGPKETEVILKIFDEQQVLKTKMEIEKAAQPKENKVPIPLDDKQTSIDTNTSLSAETQTQFAQMLKDSKVTLEPKTATLPNLMSNNGKGFGSIA